MRSTFSEKFHRLQESRLPKTFPFPNRVVEQSFPSDFADIQSDNGVETERVHEKTEKADNAADHVEFGLPSLEKRVSQLVEAVKTECYQVSFDDPGHQERPSRVLLQKVRNQATNCVFTGIFSKKQEETDGQKRDSYRKGRAVS